MSELLLPLFSYVESFITKGLSPILVIGVLVFIHELGHFLFAKWCGVGVVKFSVGFGPAILKFRHKETTYQLSIIPLGGFVRMVGDMPDMITGAQPTDDLVRSEGEELDEQEILEAQLGVKLNDELKASIEDKNQWFIEKNYWQKSAIVFAGPLFNFLLSIILIFFSVALYGQEEPSDLAIIGDVMKGSPAQNAGLEPGDLIASIQGKKISKWVELAEKIQASEGKVLSLSATRQGELLNLRVKPQAQEIKNVKGDTKESYFIGINRKTSRVETSLYEAAKIGVVWTYNVSKLTLDGIFGMFAGNVSKNDIAGPVFIFQAAADKAEEGFESLIHFTALLSVSLAILNLLPVPVLDGGHLVFFLLEAIFGPMSIKKKEAAQLVGFLLLLSLMVFAVSNDLTRDTSKLSQDFEWEEEK